MSCLSDSETQERGLFKELICCKTGDVGGKTHN